MRMCSFPGSRDGIFVASARPQVSGDNCVFKENE